MKRKKFFQTLTRQKLFSILTFMMPILFTILILKFTSTSNVFNVIFFYFMYCCPTVFISENILELIKDKKSKYNLYNLLLSIVFFIIVSSAILATFGITPSIKNVTFIILILSMILFIILFICWIIHIVKSKK